jgi:hypothetical protein
MGAVRTRGFLFFTRRLIMSSSSRPEHKSSQQPQEQQRTGTPAPSLAGHGPTSTQESSPGSVAGTVKDKAEELVSSLGSRVGDAWDSTKHGAQYAASAVADTAEGAWDEIIGFVSHHPLATVAAGGGLAYLLFRSLSESSGSASYWPRWRERSWGGEYPEQQRRSSWERGRGYGAEGQRQHEPSRLWEPRESRTGQGASAGEGSSFTERAQDLASAAAERVGQAWESTRQGAQQLASTVADRAGDAWETMGDWGRGYPLGTLLVGVALGFGLDELLRSQGLLGCRTESQQQRSSGARMHF